ncbi:MAG: MBL fold metallo-hydrolase [Pseudomonadota bacterium]
MNKPDVTGFFDPTTHTVSYVVADPKTRMCAVIDSVLDYDQASGRMQSRSAEAIIDYILNHRLTVEWIIDTHVHADHLTAAQFIKQHTGGRTGIGEKVKCVQQTFGKIFNENNSLRTDGSQFDWLFKDGETYKIGSIDAHAMLTPGHTPACMSHSIGDCIFVGDTLFMPDFGTARCDFPGGDAGLLYDSIQKIFALPDETRMYLCHDYKTSKRTEFSWETTVGDQKRSNIHVKTGVTREEFITKRRKRDAMLGFPDLILPSVQVNMRAGHLPPPETNGKHYIKIPINVM